MGNKGIFRTLVFVLTFVVLLVVGITIARKTYPGDTLYSFQRSMEGLEVRWASILGGREGKIEKHLALADDRLNEIEYVVTKSQTGVDIRYFRAPKAFAQEEGLGDYDTETQEEETGEWTEEEVTELVDELSEDYEENMEEAEEEVQEAVEEGEDATDVAVKMLEIYERHVARMLEVREQVPEQAKASIDLAMAGRQHGYETAVSAISGQKQAEIQERIQTHRSEIALHVEQMKQKRVEEGLDNEVIEEKIKGKPEGVGRPERIVGDDTEDEEEVEVEE